jgi:hypothetical protein
MGYYRGDRRRGLLGRFVDKIQRLSGLYFVDRIMFLPGLGKERLSDHEMTEPHVEEQFTDRGIPEADLSEEERKKALDRYARRLR